MDKNKKKLPEKSPSKTELQKNKEKIKSKEVTQPKMIKEEKSSEIIKEDQKEEKRDLTSEQITEGNQMKQPIKEVSLKQLEESNKEVELKDLSKKEEKQHEHDKSLKQKETSKKEPKKEVVEKEYMQKEKVESKQEQSKKKVEYQINEDLEKLLQNPDKRPLEWNTKQLLFKRSQVRFINKEMIRTLMQDDISETDGLYVHVTRVEISSLVPPGENYTTLLCQVTVFYVLSENDTVEVQVSGLNKKLYTRKQELVAKVVPQSGLHKLEKSKRPVSPDTWHTRPSPLELLEVLQREKMFYEEFWPLAAKKLNIIHSYHHEDYVVPKYLKTRRTYCLFMEDMIYDLYLPVDRTIDLDFDHCQVALKALARIHAVSIALQVEGSSLNTEKFHSQVLLHLNKNYIYYFIYKNGIRSIILHMAKMNSYKPILGILEQLAITALSEIIKYRTESFGRLKVLLHGDFWSGNILFKYGDRETQGDDRKYPISARLIDFQWCQWGSPAIDILQLLFISGHYDMVKLTQREQLINIYHSEVINILKNKLNISPIHFRRDLLDQDVKEAMNYGIINSLSMRWILRYSPLYEQAHFTSLMNNKCFEVDSYWRKILQEKFPVLNHFFENIIPDFFTLYSLC